VTGAAVARRRLVWLAGTSLLAAGAAHAADPAGTPQAGGAGGTTVSEVVVTADKAGLLERRPSDTVLGLTKPLIETPRAASLVSAATIQRYGVKTINDLVDVSPSTYTASFYGVPGALDVRGTLAENYFRGFKLIENRGTFSTPIGDASQIQVVRGPPSPIYGPGKVGGFLNFIPKSAATENLTRPSGEIEGTFGSYQKKNFNGQFGAPLTLGAVTGGVYAYGEIDDSGSFYKGMHPRRQLGEVSADFDFGDGWRVFGDVLVYHSTGDIQTPGWNRITPQLIATQTYVTGRNTTLTASPGAPYLTPNQANPDAFGPYPFIFTPAGVGFLAIDPAMPPAAAPTAKFQLTSPGAGAMVRLSPRDVSLGYGDFSDTFSPTVVAGVSKALPGDSELKLQLFYNGLSNKRFVSYGFPAWFRADAFEARGTYDFKLSGFEGAVSADTIAGISYRHYQGRIRQSFELGLIAPDRRDVFFGETPADTLCDPFVAGVVGDQVPANCQGWEFDVHSAQSNEGVFATTDISILKRLDIILGGRYDGYQVKSTDTGILASPAVGLDFNPPGPASASKGAGTWSASVSYKLGFGLMPYFTYARDSAIEFGQGGELNPAQITGNGWLSRSQLTEGGLKFQLFNHTLVGSVDAYSQRRTGLAGLNSIVQSTRSTGFEFEVRYLATRNLSFTLSGNSQHTQVIGPDAGAYYLPAYAVCANNLACELNSWGGSYLTFNFSKSPIGRPGNYELTTIPHSVISAYANYITDEHEWGRAGVTVGLTHVTHTSGTIVNAVVYPAYDLVNASAFYQKGPWEIDFNVDNLFDKLYFTPNSDPTFSNVGVLPGLGREWRVTLKHKL